MNVEKKIGEINRERIILDGYIGGRRAGIVHKERKRVPWIVRAREEDEEEGLEGLEGL